MFRRVLPVLAATLLVACGGSGDDASSTPATAAPAATTAPAAETAQAPTTESGADPAVVPAALQFSAPLVGGGEIEMGALAGRPVLLWFWAPW